MDETLIPTIKSPFACVLKLTLNGGWSDIAYSCFPTLSWSFNCANFLSFLVFVAYSVLYILFINRFSPFTIPNYSERKQIVCPILLSLHLFFSSPILLSTDMAR